MFIRIRKQKRLILLFIFFVVTIAEIDAQKIVVKNVNGNPVKRASVTVQVYYKALNYIFNADKEKLFTFVTDTTGVVELKGEFQNDNFEVKSISIKVEHEDYSEYSITTLDYSTDPKFRYNIYLTYKNNDVNIKTFPKEENNEIEIYTSAEIAKKLKVKEEDIINMIEKGKLKGKKISEKYFVSRNELIKYLDE